MNTRKQILANKRMMWRYVCTHNVIYKNNPVLKHIMKVAYQYGPRAIGEFTHRICRNLLGTNYLYDTKSPYFKGQRLTKKGLEILSSYKLPL